MAGRTSRGRDAVSESFLGNEGVETARALVQRLFVLERTLTSHGEAHPMSLQAAVALAEQIERAGPPFALQFVEDAIFFDRTLVVFEPASFLRGLRVAEAFRSIGVTEFACDATPSAQGLLTLGRCLVERTPSLEPIDGLRLRKLGGTQSGTPGEEVEPDHYAAVQLVRAMMDTERLASEPLAPWRWSLGAAVLRRIERALGSSTAMSVRFFERAPGEQTVARRAVNAATLATAALTLVGTSTQVRRATAHAVLAACVMGLRARGGSYYGEALSMALTRMVAGLSTAGRGAMDVHRVRACGALHDGALRPETPARWHPTTVLVIALYEMERMRCPGGVGFDLENIDLLAALSDVAFAREAEAWGQCLSEVLGVVAPGAKVVLPDGTAGRSLGGDRAMVFTGEALVPTTGALEFPGEE